MAILGRGQLSVLDMNDVIVSPTQPSNPIEGTMWWDGKDLRVYSNGSWGLSSNYQDYVKSRGENLVTNGTGLLGNNTNFSGFSFDGAEVFAGGGSFYTATQNATKFNDEFIPVDTSKKYRISLMAKSLTGLGYNYMGSVAYDIDKNIIDPYHYYASTKPVTTLAQDLKVGDTAIYLTDSTGFIDNNFASSSGHLHSILFWGYKNSFGYEYPVGTYSRLIFTAGWNDGAINRTTHVITLNKPFSLKNPNDPQGIFRAGQKVSPTQSGGSYQYSVMGNRSIPKTWSYFEGTQMGNGVGANQFPYGTAFIKLLYLLNRNTGGGQAGDATWINSISVQDITDLDELGETVTDIQETLGNMANDNIIDFNERQVVKDNLKDIIGYIIGDSTTTLPTTTTLDAGTSGKGSFYYVRKNATMATVSTSHSAYVDVATKYNALKTYLEGLTPIDAWDLRTATQSTNITVVKDTFRNHWLNYYKAELELANVTADQLKKNVDNVEVGATNWASNGNFEWDITKSTWSAQYTGQVKEVVDISTETPPFKYAYHVKNTVAQNGGIFSPVIWSGSSAEALVNKEITVSFWLKYQNIAQGASSFNLGRFGEIIIEGLTSGGSQVYTYNRFQNPTTFSQSAYISGTNMTWLKYSATLKLTLPATAVKLSKIMFKHGLEGCVGEFWTTGIKIERGNKETDWSPSPLDINARMTDVEFKVLPDQIYMGLKSVDAFSETLDPSKGDYGFQEGLSNWRQDHSLTTPLTGATIVPNVGETDNPNVVEITGEKWVFYNRKIPIDTNKTYRVRFRVRQTVDPTDLTKAKVYAGVAAFDRNKAPLTTSTLGSHRYCAISAKGITVAEDWVEFSDIITGEGNESVNQFIEGTKYATPMFIVNYQGGNGKVQVDFCGIEDITLDNLGTSVKSLDQRLTPSGITTVISQSDFYNEYTNALEDKANADDLTGLVNETDLPNLVDVAGGAKATVEAMMDDANSKLAKTYSTKLEVEETAKAITDKFSATGGMNILHNSIGYADFDLAHDITKPNWVVKGVASRVSRYSDTTLDTLGFGSGFKFIPSAVNTENTSIDQKVTVIPNKTYTLSWYIKKTNASTAGNSYGQFRFIFEENAEKLAEYVYTSEQVTNEYEANFITITPTTSELNIRAYAHHLADVVVTGMMFTIGDLALQWSLATGETYNTNVRIDITGVRVSTLETDPVTGAKTEKGFTRITPDEFAGYYDVTGDGIPDRVFWLNGDELVARRVKAETEFTMGSIKIVKVPANDADVATAGNVGWAFIPQD